MATSHPSLALLFIDLPHKTFVGINLISFNSSPHFQGIKNVPAGLYFIYAGADASLSMRNGAWLHIPTQSSSSMLVLKWSVEDERLKFDPNFATSPPPRGLIDYTTLANASSTALDKSSTTATVANTSPGDFATLSSHLTPGLLSRILPPEWSISSISTAPRDSEIEDLPHLEPSAYPHGSNLGLLDIDVQRTWAEGDVGSVRTERARDRSWYLGYLMDIAGCPSTDSAEAANSVSETQRIRQHGAKMILGELQFCFLMVLTLANYSCLEQWKRLLTVAMTCKEALGEIEGYFVEVLGILSLQLKHADDVEGGLFELRDEVGSAWLRALIERFSENVKESGEMQLKRAMERFQKEMKEDFDWEGKGSVVRRGMLEMEDGERVDVAMDGVDEDEEKGEYAPVVVEL